jgi:hypothetical protein
MVVMLTLPEAPVISMEVQEEAAVALVAATEVSAAVLRQALVGEVEEATAAGGAEQSAKLSRLPDTAAAAEDLFLRPRQRMS